MNPLPDDGQLRQHSDEEKVTGSTHTSHTLVGRNRPTKINARYGRRRILYSAKHQDEFLKPWILQSAKGLSEDHES